MAIVFPAMPSRRRILHLAWPIVLANCAVPMLGLVDTAVIGNTGSVQALGAIALGSLVFSFLFWTFGFLRMGTTGFTAQAAGAGDEPEVRAGLARALLTAGALGVAIIVLREPVTWTATTLLSASAEIERVTAAYIVIRAWGAPATLSLFAISGLLIGLGRSRALLAVHLVLNGLNIALDLVFAGVLGWGVRGIALGTAIAEWSTLGFALLLVLRLLRRRQRDGEAFWPLSRIRDRARLIATLRANADIMIRTLFLLFGFAWFTNQGARYGATLLAANHLLLQLISFSAFFLDGFAFVTESLVGGAVGTGDRAAFDRALRRSTELAAATAMLLASGIALFGDAAVALLTDLPATRVAASAHLPFAAVYVALSFPAFQLDGVFIGATRTRDMRNASILAAAVYLAAWWPLATAYGNRGLWTSFIVYVVARAAALLWHLPALRSSLNATGDRVLIPRSK